MELYSFPGSRAPAPHMAGAWPVLDYLNHWEKTEACKAFCTSRTFFLIEKDKINQFIQKI